MTFHAVLRSKGFRRVKSYHKSITCMIHESDRSYAGINKETWGQWVWAVGDGIPNDGGYPGGRTYYKPEDLNEQLNRAA